VDITRRSNVEALTSVSDPPPEYVRDVTDQTFRPGASGVFKVIVESARRIKRAVTGGDRELSPDALELGYTIARAFVAQRFDEVHNLGTRGFQQRTARETFATSWGDAVRERETLTGFDVANAGDLDVGLIPGLEEVPQAEFAGFVEIVFSSPGIALDDDRALTVGAVLLHEDGKVRLGALHSG
jgi:hypothetical protein